MGTADMSTLSRSLATALAAIVLLVGGCATDLAERRLGFVSMGMTPAQVARLLGEPVQTDLTFETGRYSARMTRGKLDGVFKHPEGMSRAGFGIDPAEYAALGLRDDASTMTDVEAALGQPSREEAWYYVNDLIAFAVNFEKGRAVSKSIIHLPPI